MQRQNPTMTTNNSFGINRDDKKALHLVATFRTTELLGQNWHNFHSQNKKKYKSVILVLGGVRMKSRVLKLCRETNRSNLHNAGFYAKIPSSKERLGFPLFNSCNYSLYQ